MAGTAALANGGDCCAGAGFRGSCENGMGGSSGRQAVECFGGQSEKIARAVP